jgi:hypothetical protein
MYAICLDVEAKTFYVGRLEDLARSGYFNTLDQEKNDGGIVLCLIGTGESAEQSVSVIQKWLTEYGRMGRKWISVTVQMAVWAEPEHPVLGDTKCH